MPSIFEVRHSPEALVVVVVAVEAAGDLSAGVVVVFGFCAKATVASRAVPARPAAIDFINMVVLSFSRKLVRRKQPRPLAVPKLRQFRRAIAALRRGEKFLERARRTVPRRRSCALG